MENTPVEEKKEERRKYTRFKVQEGTLAFFNATPYEIIDICEAGMAVRALSPTQEDSTSPVFDLFAAGKNNYLPHISSTIVNQFTIFPTPMFSVLPTTRWCVQFKMLDEDERTRLSSFIDENSVSLD
ncbi:MAG: hypothetical protein CSA31_02315 [Desulfobulbus propionicus]|nr:MAG: hypothetical protein CSA31_02315 [Desulfobulbus propionicus]